MPQHPKLTPTEQRRKPISMHEEVPVWYDCCSCEAEPYWQAIAGEIEEKNAAPGSRKNTRKDSTG